MKKVVILQHNGGQLCNQLWNFISIYAYCLEKRYECRNYSFFEYNKYFNIPVGNWLIDFLFFKTYSFHSYFLPFRIARKIGRVFYSCFVALIRFFRKKQVVYSGNSFEEAKDFYYLSPAKNSEGKLAALENNADVRTIYFDGWLFRNPEGIKKYHSKIVTYFQPKKIYKKRIGQLIKGLREKYTYLVGVHIRQKALGDPNEVIVDGTKMWISAQELGIVEKSLKIYLEEFKKEPSQTCFVICSNKKVDSSYFSKEINVVFSAGNLIEDLYTLSKTDAIIGCRSTFGTFAAHYGNIPHFTIKVDGEIKKTNFC